MIEKDYKFEKIKEYKEKAIKEAIYNSNNVNKYECCPYCGSIDFIKFGKYQGIQRYKCKNNKCKKTFSNTTNSIWKYLKHAPEKWLEFIELMGENNTLTECSNKLKISIVTAFNWRHKILHAIEENNKPKRFKEFVTVRTHYIRKCYKGSRNKNYSQEDKRINKINRLYGITQRDVCVLIAGQKEELPIIESSFSKEELEESFKNKVLNFLDSNCYIHSNKSQRSDLTKYIIKHNKKIPYKIRKKYGFKVNKNILQDNIKEDNDQKNLFTYLTSWLYRFRGIATKYVNHYYNFFFLINSEKEFDCMSIFFELLNKGVYISIKMLKDTHLEYY